MNFASYIRNFALSLIILFFSTSAFAQKNSEKGDKYFDKNLFTEAIQYYQLEIKAGNSKTVDYAMQKLADCYRITGEFEKAEETYKKILKKKKKDPVNSLNYAQSLKSSAKYAEAAVQFKEYMKLNPTDPMGKIYLQSCDSAQKWLDETRGNEVKNIERINTPFSEFAPVFLSSNELIFTSAGPGSKEAFISFNGGMEIRKLDLYKVDVNTLENEKKATIENLSEINTPLHEGPATFSRDGKELYFTRTIIGKKDKATNKVLNTLQVFYCFQDSTGKWSKPVNAFPFNSSEYSVGQPSLSKDGRYIFFMSDMPGGFGGTDIYYSVKLKDGTWGKPINLGNEVNTFGHELFPFYSDNGILYFSSDTHPGMGQLDIFSAVFEEGEWTNVRNLKPPINSIANDFGIALDQKSMRGFFSSDRFNGKGEEDIYSFSEIIPLKLTVNGGIIQFPDKSIYDGIKYKLIDEENKAEENLESKNGLFSLSLKQAHNYTLAAKKNGFPYNKIAINLLHDTLENYLQVKLNPSLRPVFVQGYLLSGLTNDTSKLISKEIPVENISVSLIDSTTTIEKNNSLKNGFFEFKQKLNGNEPYTILAKINIPKIPPDPIIKCQGIITYSGNPIPDVSVKLLENGQLIEIFHTGKSGHFAFELDLDKKYSLVASKIGFDTNSTSFITDLIDIKKGIFKTISLDSLGSISLQGIVKNASGVFVQNAQLTLRDENKIIGETKSLDDGKFNFTLLPEHEYHITATTNGYFQKEVIVSAKNKPKSSVLSTEIVLDSIKVNAVIEIKNLYYDYNKPEVQFASWPELDKLVDFLKANPSIMIELSAHTDSRGNPDYNLKLSQARAQNAKDYLTLEDISPNRVKAVGYGKNKPILMNAKTENEHQINRRTEIIILKK